MTAAVAPEAGAEREAENGSGYELFILGISLLAVSLLLVEFVVPLEQETRRLIQWVDHALCALFFVDFVRNVATAPDRWRYLRTTGWLDLLSSVPAIEAFRLARVARVVRVLRALRVLLVSHTLGRRLRANPRGNALLTAAFICGSLVAVGAVAVLEAERGQGNIADAGDALWWAITTITTVGYGDHTPVTPLGRAIGVVLMLVGVGAFGLLAGLLASVLVEVEEERQHEREAPGTAARDREAVERAARVEAQLTALQAELHTVVREVTALRAELGTRPSAPGFGADGDGGVAVRAGSVPPAS